MAEYIPVNTTNIDPDSVKAAFDKINTGFTTDAILKILETGTDADKQRLYDIIKNIIVNNP
jgi:hypothetical protein